MRCWPALCYASLRPLALDLTCLHCVAIIRLSMLSLGLLIYAMLGSDLCSWVSFWYALLLCSALLPCATLHYTRCRVLPNGTRPHMLSEHWNFVAMIISTTLCVGLIYLFISPELCSPKFTLPFSYTPLFGIVSQSFLKDTSR